MMQLTMTHRCSVCRREVDGHKADEDRQRADFVGSMPWALCVCGMEMPGTWTPAYRLRWLRAMGEAAPDEELREALDGIPIEDHEHPDDDRNHAGYAADSAVGWLEASLGASKPSDDGLAMAEAWATRCLGYIRRERARRRAGRS